MVNQRHKLNRSAFTMIELIFAIVVIAISVISLPMMTQVNSKGMENSIVQEAIFAASAELMGASAGYWDLNSMQDNNVSHISRVIDIDFASPTLKCEDNASSSRYRLRAGHIEQPLHRRCVVSETGDVNNTSNSTYPNLNNAAHTSQDIFVDLTGTLGADAAGYKTTYKSIVQVAQNAADGNIKDINITITDNEATPNTLVLLKMKSANVGEIDYFKRRF